MENNEYFASINEVSKRLSVPAHTLRYWEKQFPNIIRPTTGAGGRRYYRTETVDKLIAIQDLLHNRGMTIAGVKKLLRSGEFPHNVNGVTNDAKPVAEVHINTDDINAAIDFLLQAKGILV